MLRSITVLPRTIVRGLSASATSDSRPPSKKEVEDLFANKGKERSHAYSKNSLELVGGVAADPVLKTTKNNGNFTIVNVITNHKRTLPNGEADNHPVFLFGPAAEAAVKNIKKGTRVLVEARLTYNNERRDDGERARRQFLIHGISIQPFAKKATDN